MTGRPDFEIEIDAEVALAESSGPREPLTAADSAWRPNPQATLAYEARLESLRGAYEAVADE